LNDGLEQLLIPQHHSGVKTKKGHSTVPIVFASG
jgi:hypothetical protein